MSFLDYYTLTGKTNQRDFNFVLGVLFLKLSQRRPVPKSGSAWFFTKFYYFHDLHGLRYQAHGLLRFSRVCLTMVDISSTEEE